MCSRECVVVGCYGLFFGKWQLKSRDRDEDLTPHQHAVGRFFLEKAA